MDLLACLLGYESLKQMIEERGGGKTDRTDTKSNIKDSLPQKKKWKPKLAKKNRPYIDPNEGTVRRKVVNIHPKK